MDDTVYDQQGNLCGFCRISDVQPLGQHPASKPDTPPGARPQPSAALTREMDAGKVGPPNTLQAQPKDAAGTPKTARPSSAVTKAARARRPDVAEVAIVKRAAAAVRLAIAQGQTPAGIELARVHAAGQAADELRQHRARSAGRVAKDSAGPVADPALAAGYGSADRNRRLINSTPCGPMPDQADAPNARDEMRSWEAAQAELKRLRGGV